MTIKLEYIGTDSWNRPVYKDDNGNIYKDVNLGKGNPDLHTSTNNNFDGEPDYPVNGDYEIMNDSASNSKKFQYLMLAMLKSRCDYYLGYGHKECLCKTAKENIIDEMVMLYNGFSTSEKPEWISMELINDYKKDLFVEPRVNRYLVEASA